jgi:DNA modification methylase
MKETRKISELRGWEKNPRGIKKDAFERLKRQVSTLPEFKPVVITPDGEVIGGNMRLKAYQALGHKEVWVSVVEPKDEAQKVAIALADNDRAGYYEEEGLAELLASVPDLNLEDYHLDLGKTLSAKDLLDRFGPSMNAEDDGFDAGAAYASIDEAETKEGDTYRLGRHTLRCGDSTKTEQVSALMGGVRADMMFTDPPYGVSYGSGKKGAILGDLTQTAIPLSFKAAIEQALNDDARFYLCGGSLNAPMYWSLFDAYTQATPIMIVWRKESFVMRPNNYHSQYEIIYFGWKGKGGGPKYWYGDRKASDIWDIRRDNSADYLHPTQKPIEIPARGITYSCPKDGTVYEPFCGSGSTLMACEQLGRTCYMMELDPRYCDVIVKRWETFTGEKAELLTKKDQ